MRNRQEIPSETVKRWSGANNLPGAKTKKPGWKGPLALVKVIIWQYAVEQAGSDEVLRATTRWSNLGITKWGMLNAVRICLPDFDAWYNASAPKRAGYDDAKRAHDLYNRLWYMFRERKKVGKETKVLQRITTEHPQRSQLLLPLVPEGIRLYRDSINNVRVEPRT